MGRGRWCVIGLLLVAVVIAGPAQSAEKAPSFTLELLDGGTITSDDLRGKLVVLRFMGSW